MPKQPIRCFEGTAKPYEPFWRLRNAVETGRDPEIEFYGYISEYAWMGDEITPAKFKNDLYSLGKGGPITVRIDSGGGDVTAASVIRAIMSDYPGTITVRIDGVAASAATIVAMAGSTVKIMDSAYMMIHDPSFAVMMALLDIGILNGMLAELKTCKDSIAAIYASKTGMSVERVSKMMSNETWMNAQDAIAMGFADSIIEGGQAPAANNRMAMTNCFKNYRNVPAALQASSEKEPPENKVPEPVQLSPEAMRLRAEAKILSKKE